MSNFLKGQSGFSMVQALVLSGVIAGTSLVATKLMVDQKVTQKSAETRDQVEDLHDLVYSVLQNKLHCRATLTPAAAVLGTAGSTYNLSATGILTNGGAQAAISTTNTYMNNNVKVDSITLTGTDPGPGKREIAIVYNRMATANQPLKKGVGAKTIRKTVTLRVQFDGGSFTGCYAVSSGKTAMNGTASTDTSGNDISKETCLALNPAGKTLFTWNDTNSICKPSAKACAGDQFFSGIDSNGNPVCRNVYDWMGNFIEPVNVTCGSGNAGFTLNGSGRVYIQCPK